MDLLNLKKEIEKKFIECGDQVGRDELCKVSYILDGLWDEVEEVFRKEVKKREGNQKPKRVN